VCVFSGYYWHQSSTGITDKPHPRFLVQDHILRVGGVDALSTNPYEKMRKYKVREDFINAIT
jgi:hypothetical protein